MKREWVQRVCTHTHSNERTNERMSERKRAHAPQYCFAWLTRFLVQSLKMNIYIFCHFRFYVVCSHFSFLIYTFRWAAFVRLCHEAHTFADIIQNQLLEFPVIKKRSKINYLYSSCETSKFCIIAGFHDCSQ